MTSRRAGARILATLIDVACMLPWIVVVAAAGAVLYASGATGAADDITGNLVGFVTLIVPITIAAAGFEGATRHATPGKRALRIRVTSAEGAPGFVRSLARNAIKYALPWELAHTAVFALVGSAGQTPVWVAVVLGAAYVVPIGSLVLLLTTGRALHDRVARTGVAAAS